MKYYIKRLMPIIDVLIFPFVYFSAWLLKGVRSAGVQRLPFSRDALFRVGVFPILNHYYEPQFDNRAPDPDFSEPRSLTGIDWNTPGQLKFLESLVYAKELDNIPLEKQNATQFHINNGTFESGDAEYWYQTIRSIKPARIIEIGSGNSTLMAINAIKMNSEENPDNSCEHICIEPYEAHWLEETGLKVLRKQVERVEIDYFSILQSGDILFIDSSHIIRPQGDVIFEYLQLLPSLNNGVIVHIHDIFSPRNYLKQWLQDDIRLWNEQYLLEAFLTHNNDWEIIGALNYLHHNHYDSLKSVAPFLKPEREPGSFYIQKVR